MEFTTADLCDAYPDLIRVTEPGFREFGARRKFCGSIDTVRVYEDNALVQGALESPGTGRVLVVDGGGSSRCALVGGRLAALAQANGWAGLLINGSVRDSAELRQVSIGIRALGTVPQRSSKDGKGERGGKVIFAGVAFRPGKFLYADEDGILLAERDLLV